MKTFYPFLLILLIANLTVAQENGGPYTADNNTVLLMHFDGNATNLASVGNNGIIHGSGVSFEPGVHGNCIRLNNSTFDKQSWIEVPFYDELNFTDEFSVECWFKLNSWGENPTGARSLFKKEGINGAMNYELIFSPEGKSFQANLDCIDDENGQWGANARSSDLLELNRWYHIAMYYNHSHKHVYCLIRDENYNEIYASRGFSETPPVNSDGNLMIGFGGWYESCFDGWIDEFRISNKYRKYRDDVLKDVDTNNFKDEVFLSLKDGWTVYQWPLGEFYPIDKESGEIFRKNACGPTMLMRTIHYWEYPRFPSGKMEYTMGNIDWYADFNHTEYLWDQIPKTFPSGITEEDYAPAATLSAQVGTASMKFFDYMYCMPKFLKENFHFSQKTRVLFEEEYTKEEWENIIKNELDHDRPVMVGGVAERTAYGGSGHYYIINGYNSKNEFFTDFSFNDFYWKDLSEFDYGISQDIIIYMEPDMGDKSLTLSNPIENGVYKTGSELDIKWEANNITNIILEYSSDAGYNWQTIAENVDASAGNFKWTVPVDLSDNYKVRISDKENLNVYRKTGKFSAFNQKQFSFTYPNQNSTLAGGLQNPIYWESAGIYAFKLEYSFDGQNWITMSNSIHCKEHFEFDFPDISEENVLLRATDLFDNSLTFQSEPFSLFKDPNNIFQHPVDENTVLLMHFEDNLTNAANNELKPIEGMLVGYYSNNFDLNLGKTFRFVNDDETPIDHNVWVYNSNNLDLGNNWSIEAWVNMSSVGDYKTGFFPIIIEKAESFGIFVYQDYFNDANGFHSFVNFSNGSKIEFFQCQKLELNKWYHITMISDVDTEKVSFFIHDENQNLIYKDSKFFPVGSNGEIKQNENIINIGGWPANSNRQFDGWMDELRITKTSYLMEYITSSEIRTQSKIEFKIYPNPLFSESVISFQIKTNDKVNLAVYDIQGRKIFTLVNENLNAGKHTIQLGNQITTNGVYLCKLETSEGVSTLKLIVNSN